MITFAKYISVGLLNTGLTMCIIIIMTNSGCGLYISNITGYVLGIICSYILNSFFTFKSKPNNANAIRFVIVVIISYLINLTALYISADILLFGHIISQLIGMVTYTISGFILNSKFTFRQHK